MAGGFPTGYAASPTACDGVRPLSERDILALRDAGAGLAASGKALLALTFCRPPSDAAEAKLPLGARNRALLDLYRATFGAAVDAVAECPHCAAQLDIAIDVAGLVAEADAGAPREVSLGGWTVGVRPLDTDDVRRAERERDADGAARALARAAILYAAHDGAPVAPEALPPPVLAAAAAAVEALDPMAEMVLDVACPACGTGSPIAFDPGAFLWDAIERSAGDLLGEVVVLASRFGWSECDVLAMSPVRRRHYLAMAG